ncbi:MAG: DUF4012 domain-containing protein [Acidimicrobiia bacterium]|nr:DUF4012 domain-containing protein [Acidimicrobiia bacterium]
MSEEPRDEPAHPAGQRKRTTRRVVIGVVLVLVLYGIVVAWNVLVAADSAQAGVSSLRRAERELDLAAVAQGDPTVLEPLRRAETYFDDAADSLETWWMAPARVTPFVGRQLRAVADLARAGAGTSDVLVTAGEKALDLGNRDWSNPAARPVVLSEVGAIAAEAEAGLSALDPGSGEHLIGPIERRYDEFVTRWTDLREGLGAGAAAAEAGAKLLTGPQTTLVLAANNSEMRNGSGMFLTLGLLTTQDGRFSLGEFVRASEVVVPEGAVTLDPDVASTWGWMRSEVEIRSTGSTPRFDTTAPQVAAMWEASGRGQVDNVLAVDVVALSALLQSVGAVDMSGSSLGPQELRRWILHDQYAAFGDPNDAERLETLGYVAGTVLAMLDAVKGNVADTARSVHQATRGRHLMIWSRDPEMQAAWEAADVSGSVGPDDLMFGLMNVGGNKLDFFLEVTGDIEIGDVENGSDVPYRQGRITMTITNSTPAGEVQYVAGPHQDTDAAYGEYRGAATWGVPEVMRNVKVSGDTALAFAGKDGASRAYGGYVAVPAGESRTVVLEFRVPEHGRFTVLPSGRFPPVKWAYAGKSWKDVEGHEVDW